jgi:hypothetical protein
MLSGSGSHLMSGNRAAHHQHHQRAGKQRPGPRLVPDSGLFHGRWLDLVWLYTHQ